MSHETFDNTEVAALLNDGFVAIKIDRQERPDLDHYYMTACMLMGKQGGWPLTILAFPDGRPFYAATYLPPYAAAGHAGLVNVLNRVSELWSSARHALDGSAAEIHARLQPATATIESGSGNDSPHSDNPLIQRALHQLTASFNTLHGGFGGAPRFPTFQHLRFLLRMGPEQADMVSHTLNGMLRGGIHDHVGGGIHRYTTDAEWHEPHFEKMLYDQAGLLRILAELKAASGTDLHGVHGVDRLLDMLESSFLAPDGTYYSAWDADSEGEEGRFYTWTREELERALPSDEAAFVADHFGVNRAGQCILDRNRARCPDPEDEHARRRLTAALDRMAVARADRTAPFRDENILVDWNGMMLGALSVASRLLQSEKALDMAVRSGHALWERFRPDGLLYRRGFMDVTGIEAQVDDYAWLIDGYLELAQASGNEVWLERARLLTGEAVQQLWDARTGTFLMSTSDNVPLHIPKLYDEAYESGASIMLRNLSVLVALDHDPEFESVRQTLKTTLRTAAEKAPTGFTGFLTVLAEERQGRGYVHVAGSGPVLQKALRLFAPDLFVLHGELAATREPVTGEDIPQGTVQVCRNRTCDLPTDNPESYRLPPFTTLS